jgi:hypothetical protein
MSDYLHASSRQLNDAILTCEQMGSLGHATLFRAVRDRQINLAIVPRDAPITDKMLNRSQRPMVVLLADDDGASTGSAGFRSWRRLKTWAGCALVHAAVADVETYTVAIAMAVLQGRLVLIETTSAQEPAWAEALQAAGIPAVGVLPRGGVHPMSPGRRPDGGGDRERA